MPLEVGSFINDLVISNPVGGTDQKAEGDDHLRLIKTVVKATFPGAIGPLEFENTTAGAAANPLFKLYRNITGAANNTLGEYQFLGKNASGTKKNFLSIAAAIKTATNGAEDSRLQVGGFLDGLFQSFFTATGGGFTLDQDPIANSFVINTNNDNTQLIFQGGNSASQGGQLFLYGDAHAISPSDVQIWTQGVLRYQYDAGAIAHKFLAARVFVALDLRLGQDIANTPGAGNNNQGAGFENSTGAFYMSANGTSNSCNRIQDGQVLTFRSAGDAEGSVSIVGNVTSFNTSSDKRKKENFRDFDALEIVRKLPFGMFEWIKSGKTAYGSLAQDMNEIFPDAVTHDEETDAWYVDNSKFVPVAMKAIQELDARLSALESR